MSSVLVPTLARQIFIDKQHPLANTSFRYSYIRYYHLATVIVLNKTTAHLCFHIFIFNYSQNLIKNIQSTQRNCFIRTVAFTFAIVTGKAHWKCPTTTVHHPIKSPYIQGCAIPLLWFFFFSVFFCVLLQLMWLNITNETTKTSISTVHVHLWWESLSSTLLKVGTALHPEHSETRLLCWCVQCCTETQSQNQTSISRINNPVIP